MVFDRLSPRQGLRLLAQRATQVESLDFSKVQRLSPSPVLELNQAANAFNAMIGALRSFETYVPKGLVRRLVAAGGSDATVTTEREITVLFTDITRFSTLVEGLTAREASQLLNRHFQLLKKCIEETGGTLDTYIGDGVMAFRGAPDAQHDHALRACEAANAMVSAVARDNAKRRARGQPAVRVRIGLHKSGFARAFARRGSCQAAGHRKGVCRNMQKGHSLGLVTVPRTSARAALAEVARD